MWLLVESYWYLVQWYLIFALCHTALKFVYRVYVLMRRQRKYRDNPLLHKCPGAEGSNSFEKPSILAGDAINLVKYHIERMHDYRVEQFQCSKGWPHRKTIQMPLGLFSSEVGAFFTADPAIVKHMLRDDFKVTN